MFFVFDDSAANTKVIPPTRPRYIRAARISLDAVHSVGVTPRDNPTVPIADAVSKRQAVKGMSSIMLITIPPDINIEVYNKKIAVEPGAPPISIRIINIPSPASLIVLSGTVLNPAVLGVTA